MKTDFNTIYNCFYSKITDDMYMELDEKQTEDLSEELLINALPWFEFPRVDIYNYNTDKQCFYVGLSFEEINIIATYMVVCWLDQQLANIEQIRMKYSGSDFKFTSQANHMSKLLALKKDYERTGFHLQRLYKRRKRDKNGIFKSTFGEIMQSSVRNGGVKTSTSGDYCSKCEENIDVWENLEKSVSKPYVIDSWDNLEETLKTNDSSSPKGEE